MRGVSAIIVVLAIVIGSAGCDKASHDNIDKWLGTQKGLDKLDEAMRDSDLGADLRGHAAVNLIRKNRDEAVLAYLEEQEPQTRQAMIRDMVPRLWTQARIEGEMAVPRPEQSLAKDALFFLRKHADDETVGAIDTYLIDWLTGGYYAGRAQSGRVRGEQIVRGISDTPARADAVADRLIAALNSLVAAPPNAEGGVKKIDDELLLALAATGSPRATEKLLETASSPALTDKHKGLERRVMILLERAYVDPEELFEAADPRGLSDDAVFPSLASLAKDETRSQTITSIAINLVRAAGMPKCLPALVAMISNPHSNDRYKWIVAKRGLDCGGIEAIAPVASAFSPAGEYAEIDLRQVLIEPISAMTPRADVAKNARILVSSGQTWVAQLVGLEVLGKLALRKDAAADAALVSKLSGDKTTLSGYWGDQSKLPKGKQKKLPTLGSRAADVAKSLEELAKGSP